MADRFSNTIEDEIEELEERLEEANHELEQLRERRLAGEDVDLDDVSWVEREIEECEEALAELRGENA